MREYNQNWTASRESIDLPLRWRKPRLARLDGDLFAESVPDDWIDRVFAIMALAPQHQFQVLTKRPERMRDYMTALQSPGPGVRGVLPNVWLGVSVEDQETADARIPHLLSTPAAVRWISAEPLLGPVRLDEIQAPTLHDDDDAEGWKFNALVTGDGYKLVDDAPVFSDKRILMTGDGPYREHSLDWVVVGGESGPGARPMHPAWARSLRDQCAAAGVPFFFKQWGEWFPRSQWEGNPDLILPDDESIGWPETSLLQHLPCTLPGDFETMHRVGKARAGRTLDGITHDAWPEVAG